MSTNPAVAALTREFAPDLEKKRLLSTLIRRSRKVLRPGTDWNDGHIWLTIPTTVKDVRTVGRGKAAVEEDYDREAVWLFNDAGIVTEYNKANVNELGYEFPHVFYIGESTRWDVDDMYDFIDRPTGHNGADIFAELQAQYHEYIEYGDPMYYTLLPLYIMASYVFRIFESVGYLHFNGHAASGKTQNLTLLQAFGLNSMALSSTSLSALFRSTAAYPGLLCLDEAEGFNGEDQAEIRKLILNGYNANGSVRRVERLSPEEPFRPITFPVYSPKALASINPQDHTLATRCLIVPMTASLRRIPAFSLKNPRNQEIRNHLYRWALTTGADVATALEDWNTNRRHTEVPDIRNRQWEIAQIFYAVADGIGRGDLIPSFNTFFLEYFKGVAELVSDIEKINITLRTLPSLFRLREVGYGDYYYRLKDIHELVLTHVEADEEDKWKSSTISRHLRSSGFKTTKQTRGGLHFRLDPAVVKDKLERKELEPYEDDIGWFDLAMVPRPLRDETFNWLDQYPQEDA